MMLRLEVGQLPLLKHRGDIGHFPKLVDETSNIAGVTSIVIAALGDIHLLVRALTGNSIDKAMFARNST